MMDAAKLREAICAARKTWHLGTTGHILVKTICEAAEAHLATLPKTKKVWIVEGAGRRHAPFSRTCEAEDRDMLNSYVKCLHDDGFSMVTITSQEVPA